jgi:glycosyltransferase involved in cell wall biosynthesis
MRVLFFATRMPDLCGAFLHDIDLAIELQKRGHQVTFMTTEKPKEGYNGGTYRGFRFMHYTAGTELLESSQVWICPHAPALPIVRRINSRGLDRPMVATCHFDGRYRSIVDNITGQWNEMLFFINRKMESNFRENCLPWPRTIVRTEVIRPIMQEDKIRMEPYPSGDMITLVNANVNKGVHQFIELAKRMPDRKFLGVVPYYGELWVPPAPSNIEWVKFDDDVRNILRRTRILLLPSKYESFGRIAVEAMYNKIPVIYSKSNPSAPPPGTTEGVEEWITPAGIACDRDRPEQWMSAIASLDDPEVYAARQEMCKDCITALDLFTEAPRIADKVESFVQENPVAAKLSGVQSVAPGQSQIPRVPQMPVGSALGFSGGRLKIRR